MHDQTQDIRAIQTTNGLTAAVASMTVRGPVDVLLPPYSCDEGGLGESWRARSLQAAGHFDRAA